jgi:hypothetical protein
MHSRPTNAPWSLANQPAVHRRQQLSPAVVEPRIGFHGFNDAGDGARVWQWNVAKQARERVGFQFQQPFELGEGGRLWRRSAFLPLPYGARCAPKGTGDTPLRETTFLSGCPQGAPERLALLGTTHHGWRRLGSIVHGQEDAPPLVTCRETPTRSINTSSHLVTRGFKPFVLCNTRLPAEEVSQGGMAPAQT